MFDFSISVIAHDLSAFSRGGTRGWDRSIFLTWSLGGSEEEEHQAESWIDLVRRLTASAMSAVDFKLTFKLIWLSGDDLNLFQSV